MDGVLKTTIGEGKTMTCLRLIGAGLLLLAGAVAYADPCKIAIDSNDMMQFSVRELAVPTNCTDVEVTLRHAGQLPAKVMGHDWVLAKDSDVSGIVNAGLAAGLSHGFLPENDKRIIAATKVVGGGESTTVKFSTAALAQGARYVFFCTSPGHSSVMRGRFVFGGATRVAQTGK
jgi:azurin